MPPSPSQPAARRPRKNSHHICKQSIFVALQVICLSCIAAMGNHMKHLSIQKSNVTTSPWSKRDAILLITGIILVGIVSLAIQYGIVASAVDHGRDQLQRETEAFAIRRQTIFHERLRRMIEQEEEREFMEAMEEERQEEMDRQQEEIEGRRQERLAREQRTRAVQAATAEEARELRGSAGRERVGALREVVEMDRRIQRAYATMGTSRTRETSAERELARATRGMMRYQFDGQEEDEDGDQMRRMERTDGYERGRLIAGQRRPGREHNTRAYSAPLPQ